MKEHLKWIVGDASKFWKLHHGKPWLSVYAFIKIFESLMRGFGQVCFANNPWSGVLVFIGLTLADPLVGLGALVASLMALFMSRILDQPDGVVVSGLQNYSAVLVGSVTVSLFPLFFEGNLTALVWCGIIFMAALSVCVGIGLGALLTPVQLPVYTLPFNVTTSLLFLSFRSSGLSLPSLETTSDQIANDTDIIDWAQVINGVFKSSGQVYAVEDGLGSILILVALFLNSPFLTVTSFLGGFLSTIIGLLITSPPYSAIYAGVWGYNGFLAAGCIAFFVYPNILSILLAFLNAIFTAFVHCGIAPVFAANNLPVFTFPFCLASLLFLALIGNVPGVERVKDLTFPEEHLWKKRKESDRIRVRSQDTHL